MPTMHIYVVSLAYPRNSLIFGIAHLFCLLLVLVQSCTREPSTTLATLVWPAGVPLHQALYYVVSLFYIVH